MANLLDSIIKFIGNRGVFKDASGNVTIDGQLNVKNGQSSAMLATSGDNSYTYFEMYGSVKPLRLVTNGNGNIGLYDPTAEKWLIRSDTNGNTYVNSKSADSLLTLSRFSTTSHTLNTVTIAANETGSEVSTTVTRAGYWAYAIAGHNITGTNRMYQNLFELYMTDRANGTCTVKYRIRNNANAQVTIGVTVDIFWVKATD